MGSVFRQKGRSTWMIKYYRDGRAILDPLKNALADIVNRDDAAEVQ